MPSSLPHSCLSSFALRSYFFDSSGLVSPHLRSVLQLQLAKMHAAFWRRCHHPTKVQSNAAGQQHLQQSASVKGLLGSAA